LNPCLNFNSIRNGTFVTVLHEKYKTICPSCPGTSRWATNEIFLEVSLDFIASMLTDGRSKVYDNIESIILLH
jgi:hypothetical protein